MDDREDALTIANSCSVGLSASTQSSSPCFTSLGNASKVSAPESPLDLRSVRLINSQSISRWEYRIIN
ncbi:hypothetical protein E6H28_01040 [Candidatus Bathyarchaeota archaeon]|nr:MAG: hypothetical protein E6H28_01040 [Candidatus Bathyarchaeota archaeon]